LGRKGVSKRKPSQTKQNPLSNDKAGGSVTSAFKEAKNQPARASDHRETVPAKDRKK